MADNNDLNAILNLSPEEKRVYGFLFDQADTDQIGVVTGERAVSFFERTKVQPQVLGEIWQIADTDNRGFLSKPGFCMVLRLIGHYQAGREPSSDLAFKSAPIPKFEGLAIPVAPAQPSPSQASFPPSVLQPQNSGQAGIRIPPLDPGKVAQYSGLFDRSGAQDGLLNGQTAKAIFERAGLPVDVLGKIWTLADREQRGALDQTEFIVAMHLLASMKTKAMTALPNTLPQGFYDAAARRGAPPPPQSRPAGAVPRQFTGSSIVRTSSPLARSAAFGTPPPAAGPAWVITAPEKAKYDQFFNSVDTEGRGVLSGEQAVRFFGDSGLPEDTLASIWDLADINSEGQLNKDEFAVAMYLIRQQRTASAGPLPAFLPPELIPPSMRKPVQRQQTIPPVLETSKPPAPNSAADDLFGLDEPTQPAPTQPAQSTASRDPFGGSVPSSPSSPVRFQPQAQQASVFKPFMPTSAFGASLASQNTGGSQASAAGSARAAPVQQSRPPPSAMDDLLGDNDDHEEENRKLTSDTTELANMSNQIGNLRTQMEQTQTKKTATQSELNATVVQKKDLETRLQQFRAQYEQEVKTVKDLEQQLTASRDSTKKMGQELALLEGTYEDLQTQHNSLSQALQADQSENVSLKQRITQLNGEVAKLKPEIEKLKLDARQQKGMVSINRKQMTTNEAERDRLQGEKSELEREAAAAAEAARNAPEPSPAPNARDIVSPAGSTLSSTNPFFRKSGQEGASRSGSPAPGSSPAPTAFDQLFGPSSHAESKSPPPATSFVSRAAAPVAAAVGAVGAAAAVAVGMTDSMSSDGKHTPVATPPASEGGKEVEQSHKSRQTTGLPVRTETPQQTSNAVPPPSTAGAFPESEASETLPGAFPEESRAVDEPAASSNVQDDFDSAFASFGSGEKAKEADRSDDPFGSSFPEPPTNQAGGFHSEFPPIRNLEVDEADSDSEDEDDHHPSHGLNAPAAVASAAPSESTVPETAAVPPPASELPKITAQTSPPSYEQSEGANGSAHDPNAFPKEYTGLLPKRESSMDEVEPAQEEAGTPKAQVRQFSFGQSVTTPTSTTETMTSDVFHDAVSRPLSTAVDEPIQHPSINAVASQAPKNAFDDFDDFDDLTEAQEGQSDFDFGFGGHSREDSEFNPAFDSPSASVTNTVTSSRAPTAASGVFGQSDSSNAFGSSTAGASGTETANSSIQHTPQGQHDWDAIFSGLDNSASDKIETSLGSDPWTPTNGFASKPAGNGATSAFAAAAKSTHMGGAITPGTEHDDPILKRLTGMGYARADALDALEKYDYDINKAVDHLASS